MRLQRDTGKHNNNEHLVRVLVGRRYTLEEGSRRKKDVLAMSDDFKEHVEEALKRREELKDILKEWLTICDEAEVIMEAKRVQDEELKSSFRLAWDETGRTNDRVSKKLWN